MGFLDRIDRIADEVEDQVQGTTGVDLGGSGGGRNADDVTDTNEDTSQGVTDNAQQAVEETTENVGQAVDQVEDTVQRNTGVDLGGSGGGSSDTDTSTTESSIDFSDNDDNDSSSGSAGLNDNFSDTDTQSQGAQTSTGGSGNEDTTRNTAHQGSTGTRSSKEDVQNQGQNIDHTVDKETNVEKARNMQDRLRESRDDVLSYYKDDEMYRINVGNMSENKRARLNLPDVEGTVQMTGNAIEEGIIDNYNRKIQNLDQYIAQATARTETKQNEEKDVSLDNLQQVQAREYGSGTNVPDQSYLTQDTPQLNFEPGETFLRTGIGVLNWGQENLQEPVSNMFDRFDQPRFGMAPISADGQMTEDEISEQIQQDKQIRKVKEATLGPSDELIGSTAGGVATLGTQYGGLAIATPGAVATSFRKDTPGIVEGVGTGFALTGKKVSGNPGQFVSQEAGEEVGEAIAAGAITGGAGLAVGAMPTLEFEVTPETSEPSQGFKPEDTAENNPPEQDSTDATYEDLPQLQDQSLNREPEAPMVEDQIQGIQGDQRMSQGTEQSHAPLEQADGLTIRDIEALAGREITPEERAQIEARLREQDTQRVGNVREIVKNALNNPNAIGSGPGALVPPETTQPDIEFEQDFVENDLRTDPMLDQEQESDIEQVFGNRPQNTQPTPNTPETESVAGPESELGLDRATSLEPDFRENQALDQPQRQGQSQEQPEDFEPPGQPGQEMDPNSESGPEPGPESTPDHIIENSLNPESEPEPEFERSSDREAGSKDAERIADPFSQDSKGDSKEEKKAAPSLDAVLFDIEGDLAEDKVFTGLETRPTEEDVDPFL